MVTTNFLPQWTVDRPSLRGQLDAVLTKRLTLMVAAAGSGKSVLVRQWVEARTGVEALWLNISDSDDDPVHFARQLLMALPLSNPQRRSLGSLIALGFGGLGQPFIDELCADLVPHGELVLILDDLHRMSNVVLEDDIENLIRGLPANVHVIISSRNELRGDLSDLRLEGALLELRQSDLAMNYEQSEAILSHTAGKEISSENVATLVEVTEGWAAGLQLAGLTMSMRDNPDDFVADFSGSDRFISDYLSQQVLTGLSDERRTTLLRLSALDTMSSELVLDATGSDSAQQLFDELESSSLFFIALDDRRQWFRFHHLFADLLRYQLRAERPGDEEKISARAAQWHLDRNAVDEAVPYLIRARRWEAVLSVVLRRGAQVFERGEIATVVRWIENVPESVLARNIDAVLCHGILVGLLGQSALAENILMTVTNNPAATRGQMICAEAFLSSLVQSLPGMSRSFDSALRTIELIENNPGIDYPDLLHLTDARSLETIAVAAASRAQFFENNLDLAREWMQRTLATEGAVYSLWRINALGGLALIEAFSGNMEAAGDLARESLSTARDTGTLPHWGNADAFLALAVSAIENGTPAQASIPLYEARIRAGASGRTQQLWICHLVECLMMEATAGSQPAVSPEGPPPAIVADRLRALRIRLRRATGHPDMPNPGPLRSGTGVAELAELTANALSVGQAQLAADWLTQLDGAEFDSQPLRHVQRDLLHAWAGRNGKGIDQSVRDALSLAAEHGLIEVFVRAGPEVLALAAASSAVPEFRAAILDRARAAAVPLPGTELQIPLTKREVEVLSYLPSHYTNQELAEMCFVSVNTIKTHMVHIYQKLGAPNRSSAVTRARELGLL